MKITELDKLNHDLSELIKTRRAIQSRYECLAPWKRSTSVWLRLRLRKLMGEIDWRISLKKKEIADEEIRKRLEKLGGGAGDISILGSGGETDGAGDPGTAGDHDRRQQALYQPERERADAEAGGGNQLGAVEPVRALPAAEAAGAGNAAERILRARYRNGQGLRDWQKEIMDADREGKRERLVL